MKTERRPGLKGAAFQNDQGEHTPTPVTAGMARRQPDIDVVLLLTFGGRYLPTDVAERLAAGRER